MRGVLPVLLLLLSATLAGCFVGAGSDDVTQDAEAPLLAGAPLWVDPQNTPHPAYNWPTLSSPAGPGAPSWWAPIPANVHPDPVSSLTQVGRPGGVSSGAGIALFGQLAVVPGFDDTSYIVSLANPTAPVRLAEFSAETPHRGASIIAYPDGRLVTAISTDPGFDVYDITDPTDPILLSQVVPLHRGHKLGIVPGTPILYNAGSDGGNNYPSNSARTAIYDLSDPANPVLVQNWPNGWSCHHIYFWNNVEENKYRAICAGLEYTQIWDIADPKAPRVIVSIPVHHGVRGTPSTAVVPAMFSHFAILSQDGKTLIVGDEMGGGGLPPGCVAGVHTATGSASTPLGALWFYDVTDETFPVLQGWFSPGQMLPPNNLGGSCTAHHGRLIPSEERDLLAMAFYRSGVLILDFTDPTMPLKVDHVATSMNTWEVWYNQGYLVTGDLSRGLDVFRLD